MNIESESNRNGIFRDPRIMDAKLLSEGYVDVQHAQKYYHYVTVNFTGLYSTDYPLLIVKKSNLPNWW